MLMMKRRPVELCVRHVPCDRRMFQSMFANNSWDMKLLSHCLVERCFEKHINYVFSFGMGCHCLAGIPERTQADQCGLPALSHRTEELRRVTCLGGMQFPLFYRVSQSLHSLSDLPAHEFF